MRGQWLFCTTIAIPTSQNTFENRFTLVRNVSEKCNREMTRGINARDEPTCHAVVAVARSLALFKMKLAKQRPHGINSCYFSCGIWFQKWQNLHLTLIMQELRLSMVPALIKSKDASEVACLYSAPNLGYVRFWGAGECVIKENNIIYITQLHTSEISCFVKFKA